MIVVGVDEVGRGPLAGPVAVGAFALLDPRSQSRFRGVKDSKQLTAESREVWFKKINEEKEKGRINFCVTFVSESVIDEKGLTFAITSALSQSLLSLKLLPQECEVLLDGGLKAPKEFFRQKTIIKGDEKRTVIALASIAAKVLRDRMMKDYALVYKEYGFETHKGYATKGHFKKLRELGPCPLHRQSFLKKFKLLQKNTI